MMASIPEEIAVTVRAELGNAVIVRPGDKLVVGIARPVDMATAHKIKQQLADSLPGVEAVLVDQCSALAVYRDEEPWKTEAERREQARIDGTWQP